VYYEGIGFCQYRMDMVVNETLLVEVKSTLELHRVATRQVHNYLRATNLEVGLLLHFGPEAKFYRLYSPNAENPPNPAPLRPITPPTPRCQISNTAAAAHWQPQGDAKIGRRVLTTEPCVPKL
jgi:hypothetical protein